MGFLLSGGTFTTLAFPGADSTDASAINSAGQIAGTYTIGGAAHGFLLSGGSYTSVDVPGADDTFLGGVNDSGQIAGSYDIGGNNHAFLLSGGQLTTLDFPGATGTFGAGINNRGVISGFYFDSSGFAHGFQSSGGGFSSFNFPGALNTYDKGSNDFGTAVGFFDHGGASQGFAVPEPGSFALIVAGLCLCVSRARVRGALAAIAKARLGFPVALLIVSAALTPAPIEAQSTGLTFVYPINGQVVGGPNLMLYAFTATPPSGVSVIFDYSADGINFIPLASQDAPDFGIGSYTTGVDLTVLPVGTAFFRARFETDLTGPMVMVQIARPPTASCRVIRLTALSVRYDCSGSQDQNGGITAYMFDFGDGSAPMTSPSPVVTHSYPAFGEYPLTVTETDAIGLSSTLYKQLVLVQLALLQNRPTCGCTAMTVRATGNGVLPDVRRPVCVGGTQNNQACRTPAQVVACVAGGGQCRFTVAPLGPDPMFLSLNFEVAATLARGSDPMLCTEGQLARRTANMTNFKMACTAGRVRPICSNDAGCDTIACQGSNTGVTDCNTQRNQVACTSSGGRCILTCAGGTQNNQACTTVAQAAACLLGGGLCRGRGDGRCTQFPFNGNARGNDDYSLPFPEGPKAHVDDSVIWLDSPGAAFLPLAGAPALRFDADFLSFVNGPAGNCSCHFTFTIDWNGMMYVIPPTGITLVNDAESVNCTVQ